MKKPYRLTKFLDIVRGWRLLRATSFDVRERQAVMASAQNKLSYVAVSYALLTQWEDRDLLDRDRKFGKGSKGKGTKGVKKGKRLLQHGTRGGRPGGGELRAQSWDTTPAVATLGDVMQALHDGYAEGWQEAATDHTVALTDPEVKEATEHMQAAEAMQMEASRT